MSEEKILMSLDDEGYETPGKKECSVAAKLTKREVLVYNLNIIT